jgi:hypothetical protein
LQTSPEEQPAFTPSVLVHAVVLAPGVQAWQTFAGFGPGETNVMPT